MNQSAQNWNEIRFIAPDDGPEPGLQQQLIDGSLSLAVIRDAIPQSMIDELVQELAEVRSHVIVSPYINGALTTFGPYLARYLNDPKNYFDLAGETEKVMPSSARKIEAHVYDLVQKHLGIESLTVAIDSDFGPYSSIILRIHGDGVANPLHTDHMKRDAAKTSLALKNLDTQLSCVVCLQECSGGGHLHHYNKLWEASDEIHKIDDGLGYHHTAVENVESCVFKPKTGDVYLLNPIYFHEIDQVSGPDRITMGFFFGYLNNDYEHAVSWS